MIIDQIKSNKVQFLFKEHAKQLLFEINNTRFVLVEKSSKDYLMYGTTIKTIMSDEYSRLYYINKQIRTIGTVCFNNT